MKITIYYTGYLLFWLFVNAQIPRLVSSNSCGEVSNYNILQVANILYIVLALLVFVYIFTLLYIKISRKTDILIFIIGSITSFSFLCAAAVHFSKGNSAALCDVHFVNPVAGVTLNVMAAILVLASLLRRNYIDRNN